MSIIILDCSCRVDPPPNTGSVSEASNPNEFFTRALPILNEFTERSDVVMPAITVNLNISVAVPDPEI